MSDSDQASYRSLPERPAGVMLLDAGYRYLWAGLFAADVTDEGNPILVPICGGCSAVVYAELKQIASVCPKCQRPCWIGPLLDETKTGTPGAVIALLATRGRDRAAGPEKESHAKDPVVSRPSTPGPTDPVPSPAEGGDWKVSGELSAPEPGLVEVQGTPIETIDTNKGEDSAIALPTPPTLPISPITLVGQTQKALPATTPACAEPAEGDSNAPVSRRVPVQVRGRSPRARGPRGRSSSRGVSSGGTSSDGGIPKSTLAYVESGQEECQKTYGTSTSNLPNCSPAYGGPPTTNWWTSIECVIPSIGTIRIRPNTDLFNRKRDLLDLILVGLFEFEFRSFSIRNLTLDKYAS
ncbi:hypothetical protein XELAEV_18023104mg [Xenopus laevis]|uniref:Uncharacterized protein n=1 Tax=Xenopus laevis TaxID=8355 RepID=A0A974D3P0_XENLA|nr:hypothetical protein XELAEV_18023104mg [Xenopus laevis]